MTSLEFQIETLYRARKNLETAIAFDMFLHNPEAEAFDIVYKAIGAKLDELEWQSLKADE